MEFKREEGRGDNVFSRLENNEFLIVIMLIFVVRKSVGWHFLEGHFNQRDFRSNKDF